MSKMINCKACDHAISSKALVCPNCGEKRKSGIIEKVVKFYVYLYAGLIAIVVVAGLYLFLS